MPDNSAPPKSKHTTHDDTCFGVSFSTDAFDIVLVYFHDLLVG